MSTPIFDTHSYIRHLVDAGMPVPQAEALASEHVRIFSENLATKQDIKELAERLQGVAGSLRRDTEGLETSLRRDMEGLEASLRRDMEGMEASLRHDMADLADSLRHEMKELEARLLIKLGAIVTVAIGAFAAWVRVLVV